MKISITQKHYEIRTTMLNLFSNTEGSPFENLISRYLKIKAHASKAITKNNKIVCKTIKNSFILKTLCCHS